MATCLCLPCETLLLWGNRVLGCPSSTQGAFTLLLGGAVGGQHGIEGLTLEWAQTGYEAEFPHLPSGQCEYVTCPL